MTKIILISFVCLIHFSVLSGQSIRKNYREMTDTEKINLVNAFYQLRTGSDLVNDLGNFHRDFFNLDDEGDGSALDIHFNLPDETDKEIFLAWHRAQMFEMEQAMQDINPDISLAYVDWTLDNQVDAPVWDQDFMGQFNDDWDLRRNIGNFGTLPSPQDITDLLNFSSNYFEFSNNFERGRVHTGGHNWTGGLMGGPSSPKDPIFYLHHSFVDMIWSKWEKRYGNSGFLRTSMLRYDGAYNFNGNTLPLINPNEIIENVYGVFYAENGLAELDHYQVSNEYRSLEKFYYQYSIEIGNNFIVPSNTNCEVESVNEITFKPGFSVERGGNFYAAIDPVNPQKNNLIKNTIVRNRIRFDNEDGDFDNVYGEFKDTVTSDEALISYPNPFKDYFSISNLVIGEHYEIEILNMLGTVVYKNSYNEIDSTTITIGKLQNLNDGVYLLLVKQNGQIKLNSKIIKQ